jgi:hypothetical protein
VWQKFLIDVLQLIEALIADKCIRKGIESSINGTEISSKSSPKAAQTV